jgi:sigma-E factor negative regulatory protein RseC
MLEEQGKVVEVRGDDLWVETQARSSCSHCSSSSCTTSVVSKLFGVKRNRLRIPNNLDARVGDRVVIGIPDQLVVRASVWAYLLPAVLMLHGAALGHALGSGEGLQSLLAMVGLAIGFALVRGMSRRAASERQFRPRLLRIVEPGHVQVEPSGLRLGG